MTTWPSWLYRLIDVDPEQWVWRGLCYTSLGLTVLKLTGELTLSWWWIALPVMLPFLALAILFTVIVVLKAVEIVLR